MVKVSVITSSRNQQQPRLQLGLQMIRVLSFQHWLSQTYRATLRAEVLCEHRSKLSRRSLAWPVLGLVALHLVIPIRTLRWSISTKRSLGATESGNIWQSTRDETVQDCVAKSRARHREEELVESCSQRKSWGILGMLKQQLHGGQQKWDPSLFSLSLSLCWVAAGDDERKLLCMVSLTSIPPFFPSLSPNFLPFFWAGAGRALWWGS